MDELTKVKRVIEKAGAVVSETLLVLDAQTGQNGVAQARAFTDAVEVTGVVLTKTDGSAKGGIVLAVREELGVPIRFVGVGEKPDDLRPFDANAFADRLLSA
jgi:fused signal recognition particle receptor